MSFEPVTSVPLWDGELPPAKLAPDPVVRVFDDPGVDQSPGDFLEVLLHFPEGLQRPGLLLISGDVLVTRPALMSHSLLSCSQLSRRISGMAYAKGCKPVELDFLRIPNRSSGLQTSLLRPNSALLLVLPIENPELRGLGGGG